MRPRPTAEFVCATIMASSRDIFALPGKISRAILASTGANEGNLVLNMMALVGRLWHNALAPNLGQARLGLGGLENRTRTRST